MLYLTIKCIQMEVQVQYRNKFYCYPKSKTGQGRSKLRIINCLQDSLINFWSCSSLYTMTHQTSLVFKKWAWNWTNFISSFPYWVYYDFKGMILVNILHLFLLHKMQYNLFVWVWTFLFWKVHYTRVNFIPS